MKYVKNFNENFDSSEDSDNKEILSMTFAEWAADLLYIHRGGSIGYDKTSDEFLRKMRQKFPDTKEVWSWHSDTVIRKYGVYKLSSSELYKKFCEEKNINFSNEDSISIILNDDFEPIEFLKFICNKRFIKINSTYNGVRQPSYWTKIKKGNTDGKYSTVQLYKIFKEN